MESTIIDILVEWGYIGLFISAFVAGSVLAMSSEAVMVALIAMGADPTLCIISATAGNTLGGMMCYWLGYLGNIEKIERWLGVKPEKLNHYLDFVRRKGAWIGTLGFVPIIGDIILILLGMLRTNFWATSIFMGAGKLFRYIAFAAGSNAIINLF